MDPVYERVFPARQFFVRMAAIGAFNQARPPGSGQGFGMADLTQRAAAELPAPAAPRSENIWIDQYFDERQSELKRLLQVVYKRKLLVIAVCLACLTAASVWL